MHNCKKNERTMYYALYDKEIPVTNASTIETKIVYSAPVLFKGSSSTGQSISEEQPFGNDVSYDRVIETCDTSLPIDENTIIWVKNTPTYNDDGTVNPNSADYKVAALPLDGLNSLCIAIKRVQTCNSNTDEENDENDGF